MKNQRTISILILTLISIMSTNAQVLTNDENVAIKGYDVVNYFTANTAARGSNQHATLHEGATYYFLSADNKKAFESDPQKYLPEFDGYCAFAVAKMNKKVPSDPETFRIDDGKLYVFFNDYYEGAPFNTMIPWLQNEADMEKMAVSNWKSLK